MDVTPRSSNIEHARDAVELFHCILASQIYLLMPPGHSSHSRSYFMSLSGTLVRFDSLLTTHRAATA